MYTCIIYDGILYFINLSILRKLFKIAKISKLSPESDAAGGIIEKVPIVNKVSESIHDIGNNIKKMSNHEVLDSIKLMGVEFFLKTDFGIRSLHWSSEKLGKNFTDIVDMRRYNMTLISGNDVNKILINVVGMTVLDLLTDTKLSAKKSIMRILAQLPIPKERELIGYSCPCVGNECPK